MNIDSLLEKNDVIANLNISDKIDPTEISLDSNTEGRLHTLQDILKFTESTFYEQNGDELVNGIRNKIIKTTAERSRNNKIINILKMISVALIIISVIAGFMNGFPIPIVVFALLAGVVSLVGYIWAVFWESKILHESVDTLAKYENLRLTVLKAILDKIMTNADQARFVDATNRLIPTDIKIKTSLGTADSLQSAIEETFKYSKEDFLELENVIIEKTNTMDKKQKEQIRNYYESLKNLLLSRQYGQ